MFRGFKLGTGAFIDTSHTATGKRIYEMFDKTVSPVLKTYVLSTGALDGSKMQADWFPVVKADVFISHSHADEALAIAFAGWLYDSFGLRAFIDSCVWGHADDLQREIDNEFCRNPDGKNYNYQQRNHSTSHVHMMLNMALSQMIDHCECLFFLKTPESTVKSIIKDKDKTSSPWIYSELSTSRLIRKKIPVRMNTRLIVKAYSDGGLLTESQQEQLRVEYELELAHLMALSATDLSRWSSQANQLHRNDGKHPLDILYDLKPIIKR